MDSDNMEQERRLETPGGHVAYGIRGSEGREAAVILLHGLASNRTRWSELLRNCPALQERRTIRLDLCGHGLSERRVPVGHGVWCDDIRRVLDAEGIVSAILVGHCLGANLGLHFAQRHPERTAGLVLVEPMFSEALQGWLRHLRLFRPLLRTGIAIGRLCHRLGIHRRRLRSVDLEQLDAAAREAIERMGPDAITHSHGSPLRDLRAMSVPDYMQALLAVAEPTPELSSIAGPVLALISSHSHMTRRELVLRELERLPDCEVVEVDAQHWIPTERPDALNDALDRWLRPSISTSPRPRPAAGP
jgi:pimeloyl-ACP methyl ester carboxylesterase